MIAKWIFYTCFLLIAGCDSGSMTRYAVDRGALEALVTLNLPINTVRWEVFGTPEYSGGVPGPTDYITLIAEISPPAPIAVAGNHQNKAVWIASGAARDWLSPHFKSLFAKHSNRTLGLAGVKGCRPLRAVRMQTGKNLEGVVCSNSGTSVVYLLIADFSG
ncbi:hypothetical protein ACSUZJ_19335 [Telluria sp. B2]